MAATVGKDYKEQRSRWYLQQLLTLVLTEKRWAYNILRHTTYKIFLPNLKVKMKSVSMQASKSNLHEIKDSHVYIHKYICLQGYNQQNIERGKF